MVTQLLIKNQQENPESVTAEKKRKLT